MLVAAAIAAASLALAGAVNSATGAEAPPSLLGKFGESSYQFPCSGPACGQGAGETSIPRGVASSPLNGHVYVSDQSNNRISEFDAFGQFVRAWGWGVADGSPELQVCGPAEPLLEPDPALCQEGQQGTGPGQLIYPQGVAVDSAGDVYVVDLNNHRVQKFGPEGEFLLMFGGEVNKTKSAEGSSIEAERNLCTATQLEAGDQCGVGTTGTGHGQFEPWPVSSFIAVGPADQVYVGDQERIQVFDTGGAYQDEIALAGKERVFALAADPSTGDLYVSFAPGNKPAPGVFRYSPAGDPLGSVGVQEPFALAVDGGGNLYVSDDERASEGVVEVKIRKFDPAGTQLWSFEEGFIKSTGIAIGETCFTEGADLYVANSSSGAASELRTYGPAPDRPELCPPPKVPPQILDQYALQAGTDSAVVRGSINPRFWPDATYYVEYGEEPCSEGGCTARQPAAPGLGLTDESLNKPVRTAGVLLSDLEPGTAYYFRFVSQSTGGGPVTGEEQSFRTFATPLGAKKDCANQARRGGVGARLPECRAYEMVSPVDKANGDIRVVVNISGVPPSFTQSTPDGSGVTYSSYRAFDDPESSPYVSQYLARRDGDSGWQNRAISPPRDNSILAGSIGTRLDNQFKAFSADLCDAWIFHDSEPTLAPGAVPGYANIYRRGEGAPSCGGSRGYQAVTTSQPPNLNRREFRPELQGVSADRAHAVFLADDTLAVDEGPPAASGSGTQVYESVNGRLRLVSVLPDGTASSAKANSVGTLNSGGNRFGRRQTVENAVSDDGETVYWSSTESLSGPGKIYARIGGDTTLAVSEDAEGMSGSAESGSRYWTAAADGSAAIFTTGRDLYRFEPAGQVTTPIAEGGVIGVAGASEDASRVYFASTEALAEGAVEGSPNLYLADGEEISLVAVLADVDVEVPAGGGSPGGPDPLNPTPLLHAAQASADGTHLVFQSRGSPTGFDNTDADSGKADTEIYLYGAGSSSLRCVSCNPTMIRPNGEVGKRTLTGVDLAARLPITESQLHHPHIFSEDGERLFFESIERLVPRDTNGVWDVYGWRLASGPGVCEELGAESYSPLAGGCISLISGTGKSPVGSRLLEASADGSDVFFTTAISLVSQDPGQIDLYDARVGGGFAPPATPEPECEGGACQGPAEPAPAQGEPPSSTYSGPGNVVPRSGLNARTCRRRALVAKRSAVRAKRLVRRSRVVLRRHRSGRRVRQVVVRLRRGAGRHARRAKRFAVGAKRCRRQLRTARLGR